ncbi:MAG: hypothetical protein HXX09_02630 [Bacteroidetes bacterium]|nr:hypothetical protein [Bacteroidota bacterium]
MKPIKGMYPFAVWLMRIAITVFAIAMFWNSLKTFDFKSISFFVSLIYIVFGLLLLIGGFTSKPTLTIISSVFLFAVSVYKIFTFLKVGFNPEFSIYLLFASVSLFFLTTGNKK